MRIVVTGARGRLGAALVTYLSGLGHDILAVDAVPAAGAEPGVQPLRADLREAGEVYDVVDGAEAVIHLAALAAQRIYPSGHTFFNNVGMTWNILEASARLKVPRVVIASSLQVNHTVTPRTPISYEYFPVDEEHPVSPQDDYGLSKYVGEICADTFSIHWGLTVASLRFPLIAAAEHYDLMPLPDMDVPLGALFAYVHQDDAVRGCYLAATAPLPPRSHTVFMMAARDSSLGAPTRAYLDRYFPGVPIRPQLAEFGSTIDSSRAERLLGWVPQVTVKR
ncbi:MAG: NAD(P)-dependent oxidoreductase [Anaerolineales bacterium]|nr:NAD(P)-dependent oxidoreductase [Anaerolineales bacterium]